MLVLSRKRGERILIGDDVVVTIARIGPNNVRVGIEAPRDVKIIREELAAVPRRDVTMRDIALAVSNAPAPKPVA